MQELVLLEREQEVLEREQTVGTLREQVRTVNNDGHNCPYKQHLLLVASDKRHGC